MLRSMIRMIYGGSATQAYRDYRRNVDELDALSSLSDRDLAGSEIPTLRLDPVTGTYRPG